MIRAEILRNRGILLEGPVTAIDVGPISTCFRNTYHIMFIQTHRHSHWGSSVKVDVNLYIQFCVRMLSIW